jgi:hypothetical protein
MKRIVFILLLVLPWSSIRAKIAATLQLLTNPTGIAVKGHRIYIADFPAIYIYSLKDFRLIKKFGKQGAGPGEFLPRSSKDKFFIYLLDETVFVESNGRVSFFILNGDFLKEFNVAAVGYRFQPFGNRFLGKKRVMEERSVYGTINLFDKRFKRVKEVFRVPYSIQPGKKILVFNPNDFRYHPGENYLYIRDSKEFAVKIYDNHFKLVSTIKRENYTLRKILPEDKKKMHSVFKVALKERYAVLRHRITFPETFAAIRNILMDGGKLYIITFKKQEEGVECFLYTPEGTFIQKLHIPLIFENILQYYPYTIHNGSLYQLIENEDAEEWELHVNGL